MTTKFIGDGEKIITTVLLNGERIHIRVHTHASAKNVFDAIVDYIGLTEVVYFGLMIIKDGEQQFLDLDEKLNKLAKYAPHLWKDDSSCNSSLVFTVFFRVKYYVENICLLQEQQTRHQYYLQLRKDVLENSIRIHEDTSMVLASYALQAELGDYDRNIHGIDYFVPQHYLPARAIAKLVIPYIKNTLPAMHQSLRGLSEDQAEIEFLKEAQKLSEYGILFHRVYKKEYSKQIPYNIGICLRGLVIYEETGPVRNPVCKFPWTKVKKMSFKRSKFIVEADTPNVKYSKLTFCTASYKRSSYLLKISSSFFNFQMKLASKIAMLPEHQSSIPIMPAVINRNESSAPPPEINSHNILSVRQSGSSKDTSTIQAKPEVKQTTIDLIKKDGSFGFSIVGGIELGGIFVKDITPGGPAALSRQINAGDRIVQINKVSFENVTRREAINTLRNAPDKSKFVIESFGRNIIIEADASFNTSHVMSTQSIAQPQIPFVQNERESDYIRVNLVKHNNTFGIGFTGGPELGGVYVKSLLPHSSAEIDGRIAVGDRLVEIDQINVENFTRKKIQDFLKQAQGHVSIVVERYKQLPFAGGLMHIDREKVLRSSPNFISITLNKKNDSLGFSITGGLDLGGIFVKYLNPNGPAACDKRLEIGDRVVGVNDISLETVSRQKALEILRNATSPVNLIIEKCVTPGIPLLNNGTKLMRSDSIKSLPAQAMHQRQNIATQSRNLNFSMQHLANAISGVPPNVNQLNTHDMNANYNESSKIILPNKPAKEVFVVDLTKKNGCFGISLTGGVEVGGIFVKALKPGTHPSIQKGDRVIEINARRMEGLSGAEAINWLKLSGNTATFILERYQPHVYQPHVESPLQLSQLSSFDGDVLQLQLQKRNNSFGLCLADIPDHRGVFIKNIMPGGSAESDGRLERGDRLLEINGINLDGLNKNQVNDLLKQSPTTLYLLVEKSYVADNLRILDKDVYSVDLKKGDAGIGLSITGGAEFGGIFVKGLLPGGIADSIKKIQKGDRLLEVNGTSLNGLNKQQACEILQKAPVNINLLLEKNATYDGIVIPESEYFTVELHKKNNGYGLNLTGGPEIDGVYVKQVQKDSAADQDGRIRKGDRLITINGRNVESSTRQKCTEMLKLTQDIAVLLMERCVVGEDLPPLDTVLTVVKLTKSVSGFGISLTGGPEIGGIFVKALMPGGCAENDGHILIGDRLVEINGQSFDNLTRQQATDLLKNSPNNATFILERYKTKLKEQPIIHPSTMSTLTQPKPLLRPTERQSPQICEPHFAFPLYNGTAPSVPPRHNANGGPGRESAFKRFEQRLSDTSPNNFYPHSNDGNTISSRQRLNSVEKENVESSASYNTESNQLYNFHVSKFPEKENVTSPLGVVDGPLRKFVSSQNNDDSPQRFIQKLSKSVVPQNMDNILSASRIPLGPISSAIFGGNRDGRNVHELLDPEITREHIEGVRFVIDNNNDSLSGDGYNRSGDSYNRGSIEQRENNNTYEHIKSRALLNTSSNQISADVHVHTLSNNTSMSKSYKCIKPTSDTVMQATKVENKFYLAKIPEEQKSQQAQVLSPQNANFSLNQDNKPTDNKCFAKEKQELVNGSAKPTGLQWISLNSNDQNIKSESKNNVSPREIDISNSPNSPIGNMPKSTQKSESAISRSPQQLSCDIPVPFASRFNNTPTAKNKPSGDFVFEVTLHKGRNGFGMNLVGGGSADNPLKIKKVAPGTSAEESGLLRVGDILLKVNGKSVDHLVAKDVISMLRGCQSDVHLLLMRCAGQSESISSNNLSSIGL
ncbi:tyrosine-protein phosphatase non-receptor type 13 isoform X1 [Hydra vulgaris]|uniref:tyrosine-protein phosphatase non-receptor type 13 isoform X1 n=1 Tax=Hydra vulgaris TaxID=6087 RepID=UPI001F5E9E51|nr:tyrosine-protein phosphatase non-receptor type 13 isoform X2 [Hydra vulgaris]